MKKQLFTPGQMKDSHWLVENYPRLVEKYPGKWVAAVDMTLAAVGDDAETVELKAKEKFGEECTPVVAFIEAGAYVYSHPTIGAQKR